LLSINKNIKIIMSYPSKFGYVFGLESTNSEIDALAAIVNDKVAGPSSSSSTDNTLMRWDGTSGRLAQNSTATLSDVGVLDVARVNCDTIGEKTASAGVTMPDHVTITDATASTSSSTGALIVSNGGLGVAGRINTNSYITSTNPSTATSNLTNSFLRGDGVSASGWVSFRCGSDSTSASSAGNKVVMGNYQGTCTIGGHNNGHTLWQPLALGENVAGATLNLKGIDIACTTTNGVSVSSIVASTNAFTGCMRLQGGLGVVGAINAGGDIKTISTTASTSSTTGSITTNGGLGVAGNINVAGIIKSTNSTSSTLITNGAIVAIGGAGIGENINAGGVIKSTATTQSSSISTGAIVSNGGIGCAKSMTVGEYVIASSAPTLGTHLCNKTYVDAKSAYTTGLTEATLTGSHAGFITNPLLLQFRGYKIGSMAFVNIEIYATTASHISSSGFIVNSSSAHRFPAGFLPRGAPTMPVILDYNYYAVSGWSSNVQGYFNLGADGDWAISMAHHHPTYTTIHVGKEIGSAVGSIFKLNSCVIMYET
jgi:hypothetical protein